MPDTDMKQSVITGTVDYLKGQPFNNVLLTALLAVVCVGLGYGLSWAVREAKSGARELISDCKEERKTRDEAFTKALTDQQTNFDKALDRIMGKQAAVKGQPAAPEGGGQ